MSLFPQADELTKEIGRVKKLIREIEQDIKISTEIGAEEWELIRDFEIIVRGRWLYSLEEELTNRFDDARARKYSLEIRQLAGLVSDLQGLFYILVLLHSHNKGRAPFFSFYAGQVDLYAKEFRSVLNDLKEKLAKLEPENAKGLVQRLSLAYKLKVQIKPDIEWFHRQLVITEKERKVLMHAEQILEYAISILNNLPKDYVRLQRSWPSGSLPQGRFVVVKKTFEAMKILVVRLLKNERLKEYLETEYLDVG